MYENVNVSDGELKSCTTCGRQFLFSESERNWLTERGLMQPPKRCRDCRAAKRREQGRY